MRTARRSLAHSTLAAAALLTGQAAWGHAGHGLGDGAHWHATDAWGWARGLAVGAVAWWLARRK